MVTREYEIDTQLHSEGRWVATCITVIDNHEIEGRSAYNKSEEGATKEAVNECLKLARKYREGQ